MVQIEELIRVMIVNREHLPLQVGHVNAGKRSREAFRSRHSSAVGRNLGALSTVSSRELEGLRE